MEKEKLKYITKAQINTDIGEIEGENDITEKEGYVNILKAIEARKKTNIAYSQTHIKMCAFLDSYIQLGTLAAAARAVGMQRCTHYDWMEKYPEYNEAFQEAHIEACEAIEGEIRSRAMVGWDEPVFQKGEQVGVIHKKSENLLMFYAKAQMPSKYRDNVQVNLTGDVTLKTSGMSDQEKMDLIQSVAAKQVIESAVDTTYSGCEDNGNNDNEPNT